MTGRGGERDDERGGGQHSTLDTLVHRVATGLGSRGWRLSTAESCTGGLVAATCTTLAGSSDWFEAGFVTYSVVAKHQLLGVDTHLLDTHGAVSEPVARAMAEGALSRSRADLAVAITGVAGPGGGDPATPVGTVWFGWAQRGDALVNTATHVIAGDRQLVRFNAVLIALRGLVELLEVP
jgi:nicotinamide-nucleotide amidase